MIQYEANLGWPFGQASDYVIPAPTPCSWYIYPQFTGRQIAEQVTEEIAAIQKSGVPEKELQRARTFVRSSVTRRMESSINRATLLGQDEIFHGEGVTLTPNIDKPLAVTGEDIQAAAKK